MEKEPMSESEINYLCDIFDAVLSGRESRACMSALARTLIMVMLMCEPTEEKIARLIDSLKEDAIQSLRNHKKRIENESQEPT